MAVVPEEAPGEREPDQDGIVNFRGGRQRREDPGGAQPVTGEAVVISDPDPGGVAEMGDAG